jgi:hypothetical protein
VLMLWRMLLKRASYADIWLSTQHVSEACLRGIWRRQGWE